MEGRNVNVVNINRQRNGYEDVLKSAISDDWWRAPVRSRNIVNFHVFEKFYEAPSDHNADGARRKD